MGCVQSAAGGDEEEVIVGEEASVEEHNSKWLLAGSARSGEAEVEQLHSSFRITFSPGLELGAAGDDGLPEAGVGATVLMVNLERDKVGGDSGRIRQIECLERSVASVGPRLVRFSYSDVCSATQNFSEEKVLGRGGKSCVFRGKLGFQRMVAIKRLNQEDKDSSTAFYRELIIAGSLYHHRIVPLVGFCIAKEGLFLVYRFVAGGSLESHLHDKKGRGRSSLSWSSRYKVALGIADAIAYLHNSTDKCVVHRDIKPSNILLSSKKRSKLCDFGLATWTPAPSVPSLCRTVKGTLGYLAPEYFQHGKVSDKTDVYAFGTVLLELLTGRKPIDTERDLGDENLIFWAKPLIREGVVEEFIDPSLRNGSYKLIQVTRIAQAADACLTSGEQARPSIDQVISILRGTEHNSNGNQITKNRSIGHRFQSFTLQSSKERRSHLALAMLGVADLEEAEMHCR